MPPGKQVKHLTPHEGAISLQAETFDPASQKLFFLTNEGSEFKRLCTYDLTTGWSEIMKVPIGM